MPTVPQAQCIIRKLSACISGSSLLRCSKCSSFVHCELHWRVSRSIDNNDHMNSLFETESKIWESGMGSRPTILILTRSYQNVRRPEISLMIVFLLLFSSSLKHVLPTSLPTATKTPILPYRLGRGFGHWIKDRKSSTTPSWSSRVRHLGHESV